MPVGSAASRWRRVLGTALLLVVGITSMSGAPARAVAADDVRLTPQFVTVAGTTFAWAALGDGPPLVLLNGTASPMSEWDPALLGALARDHRVIVFDYPGLGLSGPAPGTWTFDHAADWIDEFISVIAPDRPVDVVGWSMGGFIAQRLAVRHPESVGKLVLAATNPGGSQAVLGPRWVQEADSSGSDDAYLVTNYPPGGRAAGDRFLRRLESAVSTGRYPNERVPARTRRAMVRAEDPWLRSNANVRSLALVTVPALVITGADDVITPPVNSRALARAIPGARLHVVPGAGHSFLFQQPRVVARLLTQFLAASPA